jgi:hypothetical protein
MNDKTKERWLHLCEQASVEQNPDRLLKLVNEITRILDEKNQRVQQHSDSKSSNVAAVREPPSDCVAP